MVKMLLTEIVPSVIIKKEIITTRALSLLHAIARHTLVDNPDIKADIHWLAVDGYYNAYYCAASRPPFVAAPQANSTAELANA